MPAHPLPVPRSRWLAALLLVLLMAAGCSGDGEPSTAAAPSATPSAAAPSAGVSAAPPAEPGPGAKQGLVLGGVELGVTRVGARFDEAVRAVTQVLGEPDAGDGPACIGGVDSVAWGAFLLVGADGEVTGWSSTSPTLQTPSGVTVGTALPELERLFGDELERFPPDPDNPPAFTVGDTGLFGELSGADGGATVTRLFSRACGGP